MDAFHRPEPDGEPPRGSPPMPLAASPPSSTTSPTEAALVLSTERAAPAALGPPRAGSAERHPTAAGRRRREAPQEALRRDWARALAGPPDAVARCVALIAPGAGPEDLAHVFENARGARCRGSVTSPTLSGGRCATVRFRTQQARLGPVCARRAHADDREAAWGADPPLALSDVCPGRPTAVCATVGLPPRAPAGTARRPVRRLTLVGESDEGDGGERAPRRRASGPGGEPPSALRCAAEGGPRPPSTCAPTPPTGRPEWGRAAPAGGVTRGRRETARGPGPGASLGRVDQGEALEASTTLPPAVAARARPHPGPVPLPRSGAPPARRPKPNTAAGPPGPRTTNTAGAAMAPHRVDERSIRGSTPTARAMEAQAARTGR